MLIKLKCTTEASQQHSDSTYSHHRFYIAIPCSPLFLIRCALLTIFFTSGIYRVRNMILKVACVAWINIIKCEDPKIKSEP
jgi:hypothetical protein